MILRVVLKSMRRLYRQLTMPADVGGRNWKIFPLKDYANTYLSKLISQDAPCMVSRLGASEVACMVNYLGVKNPRKYANAFTYIRSQSPPWWWEDGVLKVMRNNAGFFPIDNISVERFCEMMFDDLKQVDVLGSWLKDESYFDVELADAQKVMLEDLEPFFTPKPWTWALEGKKVVVVHPFAETIEQQYSHRELLFENNLLPEFQLRTVKAVQSLGGGANGFADWFDALEWMKREIDKEEYDVCILGCGAYGFPLAAHVKRQGHKAIHLGGVTQLLFGIKGKRWENYIVYPYQNLYNEYWVRPGKNEKPKAAHAVEGGCYW